MLMEESKARADAELTAAQQAYKKAYEDADSDAIVEAQTRLAQATVAKNNAATYNPKYQSQENLYKQTLIHIITIKRFLNLIRKQKNGLLRIHGLGMTKK